MNRISTKKHNNDTNSLSIRNVFRYISPIVFILSFLILFSILLYTSYQNNREEQSNDITLLSERISKGIEIKLNGNLDYLKLLAKERSAGDLSENDFISRTSSFLKDHPEFINITWIDSSYVIKTVCPLKGNSHIIGLPIELVEPKYASRKARQTKESIYTQAFEAIQSEMSFEVWVPIFNESEFIGLFAGVYSCENLLKNSIPKQSFYNNHVQLLDKNSSIISEYPEIKIEIEHFSLETPLPYLDNGMKIRILMKNVQVYSWTMIILSVLSLILVFSFAYSLWKVKMESEMRKEIEISLIKNENILKLRNQKYYDLNEKLIKSSQDLKKTNTKLQKEKDRAEESDRLKTAFLQNMSHEIRTPMNAIIGFSDLLNDNFDNKPKLERFTQIINQRCEDLLNIINDILDIAKLESGQVPINIDVCHLNMLSQDLHNLFEDYETRNKNKNLSFQFEILSDLSKLSILTDQAKLKQIFTNLLNNACKFTHSGKITGTIKLDKKNNILFQITDTGIGIPEDKQIAIFDRFIRIEHASNKNIGGTGIGLSIVKGLVQLLGGDIHLKSELGKGSTFSVSFPEACLQSTEAENRMN